MQLIGAYISKKMTDHKKKDVLSLFVNVNALLFSIQYGDTSFPYMLQLETIGKSLIFQIKDAFIRNSYFLDTL
jgi:hypothetical protein